MQKEIFVLVLFISASALFCPFVPIGLYGDVNPAVPIPGSYQSDSVVRT